MFEQTVLLQIERQYSRLSTIDYGYIVENADYGIVPKFISEERKPEPSISPDVLFFSFPASTSEVGLSPLSDPKFYSPILTRSPPITFPQIKAREVPSIASVELDTESSTKDGSESNRDSTRPSSIIPAAIASLKKLDDVSSIEDVCAIDDEVELENRETWNGFLE